METYHVNEEHASGVREAIVSNPTPIDERTVSPDFVAEIHAYQTALTQRTQLEQRRNAVTAELEQLETAFTRQEFSFAQELQSDAHLIQRMFGETEQVQRTNPHPPSASGGPWGDIKPFTPDDHRLFKATQRNFSYLMKGERAIRKSLDSFASLDPFELEAITERVAWLEDLHNQSWGQERLDPETPSVQRLLVLWDSIVAGELRGTPYGITETVIHNSGQFVAMARSFLETNEWNLADLRPEEWYILCEAITTAFKLECQRLSAFYQGPEIRRLASTNRVKFLDSPEVRRVVAFVDLLSIAFLRSRSTEGDRWTFAPALEFLERAKALAERRPALRRERDELARELRDDVPAAQYRELTARVRTLSELDLLFLPAHEQRTELPTLPATVETLSAYSKASARLENPVWRAEWTFQLYTEVSDALTLLGYNPEQREQFLQTGQPIVPGSRERMTPELIERLSWIQSLLTAAPTNQSAGVLPTLYATAKLSSAEFLSDIAMLSRIATKLPAEKSERHLRASFVRSVRQFLDERYEVQTLEPALPLVGKIDSGKNHGGKIRIRTKQSPATQETTPELELPKLPFQTLVYLTSFNPLGSDTQELGKLETALKSALTLKSETSLESAQQEIEQYLQDLLPRLPKLRSVSTARFTEILCRFFADGIRVHRKFKGLDRGADDRGYRNRIHVPGTNNGLYVNVGLIETESGTICVWNEVRTDEAQRRS